MKHPVSAAIRLLVLALCAVSTAFASPPVLEKSMRGTIAPDRLNLALASIGCDTTQPAVPDGSTLTSERFVINAGDNGLGYFTGLVSIVAPDGHIVARGLLRGTVGLTERSDAADCMVPNRLEGMIQAAPVSATGSTDAALIDALEPPAILLHFRADRIPQALEPLYEGQLYGLFAPPPISPPAVLVQTDRPLYGVKDPINAKVINSTNQPIEAEDLKTDCTILWLQKRVEGGWKNVANCSIERVSQTIVIQPGEARLVNLPGAGQDGLGREPGTYRLALEFRFQSATDPADPVVQTVTSNLFEISGVLPPPPGPVLVKPERLEYRSHEPIRGIVVNNADRTIASLPMYSYCTILSLQRRVGDAWQPVGECAYFREPDQVFIPAGTTHVVSLPPDATLANHDPGVYRMVLTYRFVGPDGGLSGEEARAVSPEFRVGAIEPPGDVRVNPGRELYGVNEPIQASVTNLMRAAIQGNAWHSYCTILQLQRQVDSGWELEAGCMLDGGPTITILPGQTYPVLLPPKNVDLPNHPPGTYRLVFRYMVVDPTTNQPTGDLRDAVSPLFQIGTAPPTAELKVAPDKKAYAATDTITALLLNGATPVGIYDGQTKCTIVQLQRATATGWATVAPCLLDIAQRPTYLQPHQAMSVLLPANPAWEPGRYRFAVSFFPADAAGQPIGPETTVWSEAFAVGTPPPPPTGVAVMPDRPAYGLDARVVALIKNGTGHAIRTFMDKSFCTVVELQQRTVDGSWAGVAYCPMLGLPRPVDIPAGGALRVPLPPETQTPKWSPGVYRLLLRYMTLDAAGQPVLPAVEVTSAEFSIGLWDTFEVPLGTLGTPRLPRRMPW